MKSTVEQINPVQYRVNVEITPDEVNKAFENVFRKIQKQARIQGFRPGKAPLGVIRKLYSAHALQEVHESLINTHLFPALNEKTIRPIASPVVESKAAPSENQPFNFSAVVDILPEITFEDYKGVAVSAETYAVKPETMDRELEMLRRRQARTRPTEPGTAAAKGMLAAVSHTAKEGETELSQFNVQDMTVVLGEGELFPDLENALLGMQAGETKDVTVKLPEDFGDKELAGKELSFHVTLSDVKHLDVPTLDDEFAKDLDFENAEALKGSVREQLEARAKDLSRQKLETALLDQIIEAHPFEVPPAMVDQVIDSMIHELPVQSEDERAEAMRDQELRRNLLPTAKRRTQNTLVLWHVTQKEQLNVTDQEVQERVEEAVASTGITEPKQLARIKGNLEPRVRENMIFEKAMDFLIDNAKVTEVPAEI